MRPIVRSNPSDPGIDRRTTPMSEVFIVISIIMTKDGRYVATVEVEAVLPNLQYTAGVAIQKAAQEWVNDQSGAGGCRD